MAVVNAGYTMLEMAKMISPDGKQMKIADVMTRAIHMLVDFIWYPSNDIWSHKSLREGTGTITLNFRGINEHTGETKILTREQTDVIGIAEEWSEFDVLWIDRQPDPRMARFQKARSKLKLMANALCSAFLYNNNAVTPKSPHGIEPRVSSLGRYVLGAGGTNNLTSIYVVTHGEGGVFGVYPKFGQAPEGDFIITHTDMGKRVDVDSNGNKLNVYEDNFKFEGGLVVELEDTLGRVANIDSTTADVVAWENKLIELTERMDITDKTVIYMNEKMTTQARIRMKEKNNVNFTPGDGEGLFGRPVMRFDGIPIRKIDARILLNSESEVS